LENYDTWVKNSSDLPRNLKKDNNVYIAGFSVTPSIIALKSNREIFKIREECENIYN